MTTTEEYAILTEAWDKKTIVKGAKEGWKAVKKGIQSVKDAGKEGGKRIQRAVETKSVKALGEPSNPIKRWTKKVTKLFKK